MKRLHVVPVIDEANGVWKVAKMLAHEDEGEVMTAEAFNRAPDSILAGVAEVWVHGLWLPREWKACLKVLRARSSPLGSSSPAAAPRLVRMTHGSLSPIYLQRQGKWKKRLVGPVERWLLRRAAKIVVTCEAEAEWVRRYMVPAGGSGSGEVKIEMTDLKRFFRMGDAVSGALSEQAAGTSLPRSERGLHLLYLGRRHPLKGVELLERAVAEIQAKAKDARGQGTVELRVVSDHFGEALEKDWAWCDALALPTLSENFGLVVAEALERGKRVIVTDGAPAWEPPEAAAGAKGLDEPWRNRLVYLRGYREGTDEDRVKLLKRAISDIMGSRGSWGEGMIP